MLLLRDRIDSRTGKPMFVEARQAEALRALAEGKSVSFYSAQGVGKSTMVAWAILWFLYTRDEAKIPVTAPKLEQLEDVVWPEVAKWLYGSPLEDEIVWSKTKIYMKGREEQCFAVPRTGQTQEAMQGFHASHLLYIVDEASGVPDPVFEPVLGAMTNEGALLLMTGNPTRASGFFHDSFTRLRDSYHVIQVSALGHPFVAKDAIERAKETWGEESNAYRVRILGLPPEEDEDTLIPTALVLDAINRNRPDTKPFRVVWGVDPADYGDDRSCLAKRQGPALLEPVKSWRKVGVAELSGIIIDEWHETLPTSRPAEILVENNGVGAGLACHLRSAGLPARGINVSESPAIKDRFWRRRDELWWKCREWFFSREVWIPEDGKLVEELTKNKYQHRPGDGKIKVQTKDEFKKELRRSPDLADALVMTFAAGLDRIVERADAPMPWRYHRHEREIPSPWAL